MSRRKTTRTYQCEECGKPTSRLFGYAAGITVNGATSFRTFVYGYCAAHRELMPARLAAAAAAEGEVQWTPDEPEELRPAEVDDWLRAVQQMALAAGMESGLLPAEAYQPITPETGVPTQCPHCGGRLSWGTGPHVADAAQHDHAAAWECLDCGAAGLLM
jgi:predicted RNA-binding Zn-ribbon protein involved in translation (DUF1610 family)